MLSSGFSSYLALFRPSAGAEIEYRQQTRPAVRADHNAERGDRDAPHLGIGLLDLVAHPFRVGAAHLIFCCSHLLLLSIFPGIKVFSSESDHHIRWPEYWCFSFAISPSNAYSGLKFLADLFFGKL